MEWGGWGGGGEGERSDKLDTIKRELYRRGKGKGKGEEGRRRKREPESDTKKYLKRRADELYDNYLENFEVEGTPTGQTAKSVKSDGKGLRERKLDRENQVFGDGDSALSKEFDFDEEDRSYLDGLNNDSFYGENSKRRTSERKKQAVNDSDISFSKKHSGLDATPDRDRDLSPEPHPETPSNAPLTRDEFLQKYLISSQDPPNSKSHSLKKSAKPRHPSPPSHSIQFKAHLKTLKASNHQLKTDLSSLIKMNETCKTRLSQLFSKLQSTYRE